MNQSARDDDDANLVLFGGVEGVRTGRQRDGGNPDLWLTLLCDRADRQRDRTDGGKNERNLPQSE